MSSNLPPPPLRCLVAGFLLACIAAFSGCAHTYNVKVDALCNPNVTAGASYCILPKDAVKADYEPHFAHAVQLIETALAAKGYSPATTIRDADMVIEVDFGIGSKRKRVTEDIDLFNAARSGPTSSSPAATPPSRNYGSSLPPEQTIADERPVTRVTVITLYEKYLTLSARETHQATQGLRKPVEVWRITVAVEDEQKSVDECLPVLVATAADNIGLSTVARVRVSDKTPTAVLAKNDL